MGLSLEDYVDEGLRLGRERGYCPTTFEGMRRSHGTVEAISRLMVSGDIQSGFKRMCELGLREYSMENVVLMFPENFKKPVREAAAWRLGQVES